MMKKMLPIVSIVAGYRYKVIFLISRIRFNILYFALIQNIISFFATE